MKACTHYNRSFEFSFPELDALARVERWSDKVIVRASCNRFTDQRKVSFIHELAAEGFIPDSYQWYAGGATSVPLEWIVDTSWVGVSDWVTATARRAMIKLLVGGALLFVTLMVLLFAGALR
jgi:hypothetical protein